VARVRVAADRIEPATFEIRQMPLTDDPPHSPEAALPFDTASSEAVLLHGSPAVQTLPDAWTNADKVAHGQLAWHLDARLEPYFTFDNVLGGGAMAVKAVQPDLPLGDVAGWRF